MTGRRFISAAWLIATTAPLWLIGCARFTVQQYPDFWQPGQIESVAVEPFQTSADYGQWVGRLIAHRLAGALAANGTYPEVFVPVESESEDDELPAPSAVLTGRVLQFDVMSTDRVRYVDYDPYYDYPYGYRRYPYRHHYRGYYYVYTETTAFVAVSAKLTSAETGQTLHATLPPVSAFAACESEPTPQADNSCVDLAVDQIVYRLVKEFAVTEVEIEVKPKEALRIVAGRDEAGRDEAGRWRDQDDFTTDDTELTVLINLPPQAHRNTFELSVFKKGDKATLATQTLVWDRDAPPDGATLTFSLSEIAQAGNGPGDYEVKFFANGKDVMGHGFEIEPAE